MRRRRTPAIAPGFFVVGNRGQSAIWPHGVRYSLVNSEEQADTHGDRSFVALADRVTGLDEPAVLFLGRRPEHEVEHECRPPLRPFALCLSPHRPEPDHE